MDYQSYGKDVSPGSGEYMDALAYEEYKSAPLIMIKQLSDSGDTIASFELGERLYNSANHKESIKGMDIMLEAIDMLHMEFSDNKIASPLMAQIMATCADYCIDYSHIQSDKKYEKIAFELYQNAYELDDTNVDGIIDCYENGIGCDVNKAKANALKEKRAEQGGIVERADLCASHIEGGAIIIASIWAQKALDSDDVSEHPQLASALKIWLCEHGMTDHEGEEIALDNEKAAFYSSEAETTPAALHAIFLMTSDSELREKLAHDLSSRYLDAKSYLSDITKERKKEQSKDNNYVGSTVQAPSDPSKRVGSSGDSSPMDKILKYVGVVVLGLAIVIGIVIVTAVNSDNQPAPSSTTKDAAYIPGSYDTYASDFILPGSDEKYIDSSEIDRLDSDQTQIAINEIYARHGRIFRDEPEHSYFYSMEWYNPTYYAEDFDESCFNEYEKENIKNLSEHRKHLNE